MRFTAALAIGLVLLVVGMMVAALLGAWGTR